MEQVLEGLGNNFKCWLHLSPSASPCELAQKHWLGFPIGMQPPHHVFKFSPLHFSRFLSPSVFYHIKCFWFVSFGRRNSFLLFTQVYVFFPINSSNTFVLKRSRYDLISFTKIVVVHMQEIRFT